MLDLKNCPFCGGKAELSVRGMTAVSRATDLKYYAVVNCPSCEASVCGEATDDEDEAQPLAIAAWNRRALQAVGPEPAVAVKWEQLSEIINAAVKVAIRTGSDFHVNADKLREFARSALVATPPAETVMEEWREIEQHVQPRLADGYTAVAISKPGFWMVKGPGPAAALAAKPAVKDDETVVEAPPDDLFTHKDAWRVALVEMRNTSEVSSPDIDDQAYWQHELDVFDRVFAALAAKDGR